MSQLLKNSPLETLMQKADIVAQETDNLIYLGFCEPGTVDTAAETWAICKIVTDQTALPNIMTFQYVDGQQQRIHSFDDRAILSYEFRKF